MKKKVLSIALAGALSASMAMPAMATSGGAITAPEGTDVYAGIMLHDPDAKIKVEVPTLFAFVVNGSVSSTDSVGLTASDVLLPNVKVKVDTPSAALPSTTPGNSVYSIQTVGDGTMKFSNYSTKAGAAATDPRTGLEVKISGSIENKGSDKDRNFWTHVGAINGGTAGDAAEFKKYNLSVGGIKFNQAQGTGILGMASRITLEAPDLGWDGTAYGNMDTTTNLAINGSSKNLDFGVTVGGKKNQYKQVEESAKVGTIVWTVSAEVTANDVYTAPENQNLDGKTGNQTGAGADADNIPTVTAP